MIDLEKYSVLCRDIYNDDVLESGFHHYYIESEDLLVLSGTNSMDDWYRYNIKVLPLRPFHKGFTTFSTYLYDLYQPYIGRNTTVIGSSAGGYMAFIIASWRGCNSVSFGSPRLFSQKFNYQEPDEAPEPIHLFITNQYDPIGRLRVGTTRHQCIKTIIRYGKYGHKMKNYIINSEESGDINFLLNSK